ncbi:MAG TPA: DUF6599 family protein [Bryobacteraceae bacterium]|jgi:hypothetical protein|nr:DUF6599 family protein [Bryobacteraceae bacterium]
MKFLAVLLLPALAGAAILPDAIGAYHRVSTSEPAITSRDLWDEYGLREYESGVYANGTSKVTVQAYELQDSTGAMAAFDWVRPKTSKPSNVATYAAETPNSLMLVRGNFVFNFDGYKPTPAEVEALAGVLNHVDGTPFPTLPNYLPQQDLIPNSERYIIGPIGLALLEGSVPPSVAAFRYGSEAIVGSFHGPKGDLNLAVFNYPTPQIAMDRLREFENIPGALAKRSGPMVAVTVKPQDADEAERLLAQVQYRVDITMQEHIATRKDNIGNLVINAFILTGILLLCCIVGGLGVGGIRLLRRRGKENPDDDALITLHL